MVFGFYSTREIIPHTILLKEMKTSMLELAVAGFKRDELKVYTEEGVLHVEGERSETYDETYFRSSED
jgi:HSP20 family molecular chaperone IbpA